MHALKWINNLCAGLTSPLTWGYLMPTWEEHGGLFTPRGCKSLLHGQQPKLVPKPPESHTWNTCLSFPNCMKGHQDVDAEQSPRWILDSTICKPLPPLPRYGGNSTVEHRVLQPLTVPPFSEVKHHLASVHVFAPGRLTPKCSQPHSQRKDPFRQRGAVSFLLGSATFTAEKWIPLA